MEDILTNVGRSPRFGSDDQSLVLFWYAEDHGGSGGTRASVIEMNRLVARVYRCFGAPNHIGVEHSLVIRTTECAALGARVAHGSNCETARGTLLALGPLRSCWPLRSRWPPRACRAFLPFTAGETNRQQDNQGNRRCFHTRPPSKGQA